MPTNPLRTLPRTIQQERLAKDLNKEGTPQEGKIQNAKGELLSKRNPLHYGIQLCQEAVRENHQKVIQQMVGK